MPEKKVDRKKQYVIQKAEKVLAKLVVWMEKHDVNSQDAKNLLKAIIG